MPNIPCINPCVACPPSIGGGIGPLDPANPFLNLSSETPDVDNFIGIGYSVGDPPLGSIWYSIGCIGFCLSTESQLAADLCADQQAMLCVSGQWPTPLDPNDHDEPVPVVDRPLFGNFPQSCSFTCPDGSFFQFIAAGNIFSAFSQAAADAEAFSFACNQVLLNYVCLGSLSVTNACLDTLFSTQITGSSARTPLSFDVVGDLPPGLSASQNTTTAFFSGTPTVAGDYSFSVVATDPAGNTMSKTQTISVRGISSTSPLPEASVGTPYSEVLEVANMSGALVWAVVSGSLPDSLSLDPATGEISGTPTTAGASSFTVSVTGNGTTCHKTLEIEAISTECDVFQAIAWGAPAIITAGTGTATGSAAGNTVEADCHTGAFGGGDFQVSGTLPYTGGEITCDAVLTITILDSQAPDSVAVVQLAIIHSVAGILLNQTYFSQGGVPNDPPGIYTVPFTVPISAGATLTFLIQINANSQTGGVANVEATIQIGT